MFIKPAYAKGDFMHSMRKFLAISLCVILLMQLLSCTTAHRGEEVNLEGYELVFFDDFEGNALDLTKWEYRATGERRGGFNHPDQVRVENGQLILSGEYTEREFGEGWYSGMIRLREMYTYGYFEIQCKTNDERDFWSAFWLTRGGVYEHDVSQGGIYGAEVDIFEAFNKRGLPKNIVTSFIHCNGVDDDPDNMDSKLVTVSYIPRLGEKYMTFGVLWTENEYIFYINGKETGRSSFGLGTSTMPLEVIVSLEMPDEIKLSKDTVAEYLVDYVKIYQIQK